MIGSGVKVLMTILRDTGTSDSFIQAGVLPLRKESEMGSSIPVCGMDLNVLLVSLDKVMLHSDLYQGEAELAMHLALPIQGDSVIVGNNLVGDRVWADVSPPVVVVPVPLGRLELDKNEWDFPELLWHLNLCLSQIRTMFQKNSHCLCLIFLCQYVNEAG